MSDEISFVKLTVNGQDKVLPVERSTTLLDALRAASYTSVKYGCGTGHCGACTVLLDGAPVHSCRLRAVDAEGRQVTTVEALADIPLPRGRIGVGFIPSSGRSSKPEPSSAATARRPSSWWPRHCSIATRHPARTRSARRCRGVLCRCTGYVKIVQAVQRAAAVLRGEEPSSVAPAHATLAPGQPRGRSGRPVPRPRLTVNRPGGLVISPPEMAPLEVVGESEAKVDGVKLAAGRPVFTDDVRLEGMLYGALLTSPHAHARIGRIDASRARELPGVHAVLTYQDVPRVKYASGGQSYPQPPPLRPGHPGRQGAPRRRPGGGRGSRDARDRATCAAADRGGRTRCLPTCLDPRRRCARARP